MSKINIDYISSSSEVKVNRYEKIKQKCLAKDPNYYSKIGAKGGKAPGGAFSYNHDLARRAANERWRKYRERKLHVEQDKPEQ